MAGFSLAILMALGQITSDQNEGARIASEMMNAERAVFVWQTQLRRSWGCDQKKKSQDKESGYAGDSAALPDPGRQVPVSVLPLDHCNVSVLKEQRTQGVRSQNLKQSSS